jgi:uncharacterized membrane protein
MRLRRQGHAGRRVIAGLVVSAAVLGVMLAAGSSWPVAALVAWDAGAAVVVAWIWARVLRLDAAATAQVAASEDDSRTSSEGFLLGASVVSLVAVGFALARAGHDDRDLRIALTALAVVSVVVGWISVHTVYALRYARLYYGGDRVGGIDFHGGEPPNYSDFAYIALTIGMTYQVSDTDIAKRPIRRTAIHHALLSYLFGAVILAITVSSIGALVGN